MTDKSLSDMLRDRGTSEWHMARMNESIADMFQQRQEILSRKAQDTQDALLEIERKYASELQAWDQEYELYMTLNMPSGV